jgi:hypothetical protein
MTLGDDSEERTSVDVIGAVGDGCKFEVPNRQVVHKSASYFCRFILRCSALFSDGKPQRPWLLEKIDERELPYSDRTLQSFDGIHDLFSGLISNSSEQPNLSSSFHSSFI